METKVAKSRTKAGGRTKGTPNKKNKELIDKIEASGLTPLDFMMNIMRNDTPPKDSSPAQQIAFHTLRFEAAKAAAPYVHPKLASIEHKGVGKDGAIIIQSTPTDEKL